METEPTCTTSVRSAGVGKGLGTPPKRTMVRFSSKKEAPIAEMRMEILGAPRIGR